MSVQVFKEWLDENSHRNPELFEAVSQVVDVFNESTEDAVQEVEDKLTQPEPELTSDIDGMLDDLINNNELEMDESDSIINNIVG